jgi:hypothetical protein
MCAAVGALPDDSGRGEELTTSRSGVEEVYQGRCWSGMSPGHLAVCLPGVVLGTGGVAWFVAGLDRVSPSHLRAALVVLAEASAEHPRLARLMAEVGQDGAA